jgi:alpha-ribazole phosphatase
MTRPAGALQPAPGTGAGMASDVAAPGSRLWLVRHPRPAVPVGLCYGAADVPIDDAHLVELLEGLPARLPRDAAVYSSPLSRCLRLARALHAAGFASPTVDARLREMDFGRWEGRHWSELPREEIDAWRDDIERYVPPGGESVASLAGRGLDFVDRRHPRGGHPDADAGAARAADDELRRHPGRLRRGGRAAPRAGGLVARRALSASPADLNRAAR